VRQVLLQLLPSATAIEAMREKAAGIKMGLVLSFIFSATGPFISLSAILWILYRPKLWRMREFYADAGTVQTQGNITAFESALSGISLLSPKHATESQSVAPPPVNPSQSSGERSERIWRIDHFLLQFWPMAHRRIECVIHPHRIFDTWKNTAILVGSLTLQLDILLVSPLTLLSVGRWPMHFSTLVMLVAISLSLIPPIVQGQSVGNNTLKIIGVVIGLRLAWLLFILGILITLLIKNPDYLDTVLTIGVASIAHYAGPNTTAIEDLGQFVIQASLINLAQVGIVLIILLMALSAVVWLLRRLLTWYRFPKASQWLMRTGVGLIIWMAVVLALLILPVSTTLLINPVELFTPGSLAVEVVGSLVLVLGIWAFSWADRRYAGVCPQCHTVLKGRYWLGRRCQGCKERLHPWLITEYET
jgi:hypothetical protein